MSSISFSHSSPLVGETISKWGYSFKWTDSHLAQEIIKPLRQEYDTLGAAALERIQAVRAALLEESKVRGDPPPPNDLYILLRDYHSKDETLTQFWDELHTVPDWVDWEQLERGQRFFYRYAIANIVGFALQGFMAENSAASGVVEVLVRTGGFSNRMLLGRLLETFQWLVQVTHSLAAIRPGGEGHVATIRVRLLHSAVRQRILKLCERNPEYYDVSQHGIPINALDSIHSITTFSCNHMWLQMPKFGVKPSQQEIDDYIAVFRYLGYLLGTPTAFFETAEKAKLTMESCYIHELRITETSRVVAYNFVQCLQNLPAPFHMSRGFIEAGSRWINGDELCDELGLGRPGVLHYVAFMGHCMLVVFMAWVQRLVPGLDGIVVNFFRSVLYRGLVNRKSRTDFRFQYVPQEGKKTGREAYQAGRKVQTGQMASLASIGLFEVIFLFVFLVFSGITVGGILAGGLRILELSGRRVV
ncbi:latex clearing protein [Aspergillus udagawae]|uniref:Latex clearing protein n=1 Tax=Aspergillus udagawae TaxID=91492 RepID=A0ABQ1A7R9_9EURO|nr:latex clearing protein [Aspergillus udagawae]GFF75509.1 latex clearing protein [Aspergillus udagawae]